MSGSNARILLGMALGGAWGISSSQWLSAAYYGQPTAGWVALTFVSLALFVALNAWIRWGRR